MKKLSALLMALVISLAIPSASFAATANSQKSLAKISDSVSTTSSDDTEVAQDSAGNHLMSGNNPKLEGKEVFSCFGAGYDVSLSNVTTSDITAIAGYNTKIENSKINSSLFSASYNGDIKNTTITGNCFTAGYNLTFDESSQCNALYSAGTYISFNGKANYVGLGAETVVINGQVDGDLDIDADNVTIGDDAIITGKLNIQSKKEPTVSKKAKYGDYNFVKIDKDKKIGKNVKNVVKNTLADLFIAGLVSCVYWIVAMFVVGLFMVLFFNKKLKIAAHYLKKRTGPTLGSGAVALISIPIALIIMSITFIGLPLAGFTFTGFMIALCISNAFTGTVLAKIIFPRMNQFLSMLIGIAAIEILSAIPFLGILVGLASTIFTLGCGIQGIWLGRYSKNK